MEEKRPFGDYIRRKRQEAGLTQRELAARLFVTESSVSKWERGLSYPDVPIITSICKELGISEHEFFTACDDDKAHAQERAAAIWRAVKKSYRIICLVSYAIALVTCFICDLAIFHTLDWFWIVLTSLALAFCFTNLPAYVTKERVAVCLGAATACLILLLLSCWWYVGGKWVLGGMVITAVSLALPWGWWAVWRFYGKHVLPLCVAWTTVWVFPLLAVIRVFVEGGENWLWGLAYPLALVGGVFLWGYYLALRLPGSAAKDRAVRSLERPGHPDGQQPVRRAAGGGLHRRAIFAILLHPRYAGSPAGGRPGLGQYPRHPYPCRRRRGFDHRRRGGGVPKTHTNGAISRRRASPSGEALLHERKIRSFSGFSKQKPKCP